MNISNWLVFFGVALVVTFSPGPGILLAITNSLAHGARHTILSSLGNASGLVILASLAMTGLGAVLALSAMAFTVLKVCGAVYLIYLGIQQWRSTVTPFATAISTGECQARPSPAASSADQAATSSPPHGATQPAQTLPTRRTLFMQGLGIALTNPKAILFFSALFPQFIAPQQPVLPQAALLTGTFVLLSLSSHVFYVLLAQSLRRQLAQPHKQKIFNRATGTLFVLLGLSLLRLQHKN